MASRMDADVLREWIILVHHINRGFKRIKRIAVLTLANNKMTAPNEHYLCIIGLQR
jgi:hypothetical protein